MLIIIPILLICSWFAFMFVAWYIAMDTRIPFRTTYLQSIMIPSLAFELECDLVGSDLINQISNLARKDQGVFDLLNMYSDANDAEKVAILKDLEQSLRDYDVR